MIVVAGIGSYCSSDDEIGLALVRQLQLPNVETVLWEDADALTVAHELLQCERPIVLVDCADMRLMAGSWRFYRTADIRLNKKIRALSTHGLGIAEAIDLAEQLGCKRSIYIFAIQPYSLSPKSGLTQPMQLKVAELMASLVSSIVALDIPREQQL